MNSPIPPYPNKPNGPLFANEDLALIRKWLTERVAVQNLIERINFIPKRKRNAGENGQRATIHG